MRFSTRSKLGVLLPAITILTLVSTCSVAFASPGTKSYAASTPSTTATYNGVPLKSNRAGASPTLPNGSTHSYRRQTGPQAIVDHVPGGKNTHTAIARSAAAVTAGAAIAQSAVPVTVGAATLNATEGRLLQNFKGISNADQANANGGIQFAVTPPDQGLCVGRDPSLQGNPTVVFESVNAAVAEYSIDGTLLRPIVSQAGFLNDPFTFSDPRCFYDAQNQTFFFTIISCKTCTTDTVNDVGVFNAHGFALYQFDTTLGGTCFGDQPHVGYDNNNLYMSTDEFCGPLQSVYEGALLIAVSKSQLVNKVTSPNAVAFGPLVLGSIPILTLQPAISAGLGTEYLLNSFPYDQFGNNNSVATTLGFWQVNGGQNVTTGQGAVTLTGSIITSETYAFPVPAASTGDGSVKTVCINPLLCLPITSEAFLDPGDSRMQQVQVVSNGADLDLYASLPTAITIPGDPSARDGVAWFKIGTESHLIEAQGYVAAAGKYLLYPAIFQTNKGTTTLVFTITSTTLNPSAAYTVMQSGATSFGDITLAAVGTGPHVSFADAPPFNSPRWGDYSAAALDPNGEDIWQATEYIPPPANQSPLDNWGTSIFDVAGKH